MKNKGIRQRDLVEGRWFGGDADAGLFEESDQFLEVGLCEAAHQSVMQFREGLIELIDRLFPGSGEGDIDDAAVFVAPFADDEAGLFEPVNETGDAGDDGDRPLGDFEDRKGGSFSSEDAENVVLRGGEVVLAEESCESNRELIAGAEDRECRLLIERVEGVFLFEFVLKSRRSHGDTQEI